MVGSEFGANIKNQWTQPILCEKSRLFWGCLYQLVNAWLKYYRQLTFVVDQVHSFMTTVYYLLTASSVMIVHHLKDVLNWFHGDNDVFSVLQCWFFPVIGSKSS